MLTGEKSTIIQVVILYKLHCFFFSFFKLHFNTFIFWNYSWHFFFSYFEADHFIFGFQHFHYYMIRWGFLCIYSQDLMRFLILTNFYINSCLSSNLRKFCPLFLQIFPLPHSLTPFLLVPIWWNFWHLFVNHRSYVHCFQSIFSPFRLDDVHWFIFVCVLKFMTLSPAKAFAYVVPSARNANHPPILNSFHLVNGYTYILQDLSQAMCFSGIRFFCLIRITSLHVSCFMMVCVLMWLFN